MPKFYGYVRQAVVTRQQVFDADAAVFRMLLKGSFLDDFNTALENDPDLSYKEMTDLGLDLQHQQDLDPAENISALGMAGSHPDYRKGK